MQQQRKEGAESTAARVALWRALHVQIDPPPHVLEDEIGSQLLVPDSGWRCRPDMSPEGTIRSRASIVARARFIEDLVVEQTRSGISQYVILGAGLDTFAQRRPEIASSLRVFEIDQPGPQAWKQQRLIELGFGIPQWLRFVPVDFEANDSWWERLVAAGFIYEPTCCCGLYRRLHVSHQRSDLSHHAPGCRSRIGLHIYHDVPAAAESH